MCRKMIAILAAVGTLVFLALPRPASAAPANPALNAAILQVAVNWAHIKFLQKNRNLQEKQMAALERRAKALVQQYPNRPEPQIWLGILVSERASLASDNGSPFTALGLAKRARNILAKVVKVAPDALDAGALTSLGVLYERVPGWPIGFGSKTKARQLLEEAVRTAPKGLDANYFYGDFLYAQHEYRQAEVVFKYALTLPPHPQRPVWDKARRLVMQEDLAKMQANR